jgi:benzodiazapine receptor
MNVVWAFVFNVGESPFAGLLALLALLATVYWAVWTVSEREMLAVVLMLPYMLWISFEASLHYAVWQMNTDDAVSRLDRQYHGGQSI